MWYKIQNDRVKLKIIAKPNAKRTILLKVDEQGLHISLHAKPQDGEANKELIAFIAKLFAVPKSKVVLLRGEAGRHKEIELPLTAALQEFLNSSDNFLR